MKLFKKAKKGFTLVELVVVIAVIAILAAVSVGAYFGVTESAKDSQAVQEGKAAHTNLVLIANDPANKVCSFNSDGVVYGIEDATTNPVTKYDETDVVDAISDAAGVEYNVFVAANADQEYPAIDLTKTGTSTTIDADTLTYYVDADHYAIFDIVTGAQE